MLNREIPRRSGSVYAPPSSVTVIETIAKVAATSAKSVAIRHGQLEITYGVLMSAAEQLAVEVARHGAGSEIPVAICLERGIPAAAAILGVLRAGAAYLPLDPAWPVERLRQILDDAGARVVIASPELAPQLRA